VAQLYSIGTLREKFWNGGKTEEWLYNFERKFWNGKTKQKNGFTLSRDSANPVRYLCTLI
jgi:hypothetical protein